MAMKLQTEIERKLSGRMARSTRAFLWLAAIGFVGVLASFAYLQRWFTPTLELTFYADTAAGLTRGMAVKLVGFNVGSLDEVAVVGDLRVRGKVHMDRRYRDSLSKDSRIRLAREGVLGSYILELVPGPGDAGPVEEGSTLFYERELDYSAMAANLLERTGPIIDDLRRISARLAHPDEGLAKTVRSLDEAALSLKQMGQSIGALAADTSKLTRDMQGRIEPVLVQLQRSLAQIETLTGKVSAELPPMMEEARASLRSVQQASEAARRVIADDVPRVLHQGETVLQDTEEIVGGVRRSWPVKNMLPAPGAPLIELDSADGAGRTLPRTPAQ